MNKTYALIALWCAFLSYGQSGDSSDKTEILILGTLHFNQFHSTTSEHTNFASEQRQSEFKEVADKLSQFSPEAIFVERDPNNQKVIDSLFRAEKVDFSTVSDGMSEVYQLAFKLAKTNELNTVYGVDYYESISQNLFKYGKHIEVFKDSLIAYQNKGREITAEFLKGETSINDFLVEINKKEHIAMSHRLLFNTPAYVVDGKFKNEDEYVDVDSTYIGAEYISLFYERNLKIYTNILNLTRRTKAKKIILIVGQTHVGVLQEIIGNNPNFKIVEANTYLETES